ncbi:MAG: hypothetical protein CUN55_16890 [Phototrophicales bacterium]|nr:MAG: hypothetical protein CUN55_16890 [Phototrophicales bacterium]
MVVPPAPTSPVWFVDTQAQPEEVCPTNPQHEVQLQVGQQTGSAHTCLLVVVLITKKASNNNKNPIFRTLFIAPPCLFLNQWKEAFSFVH